MLSIFPQLLTYQEFSPLLLRLTLGVILLYWAYRGLQKDERPLSNKKIALVAFEGLLGILLIIGFLTQLAALLSTLVFFIHLLQKIKNRAFLTNGVNYYFILLVISLCLLLTGPGRLAVDLPL